MMSRNGMTALAAVLALAMSAGGAWAAAGEGGRDALGGDGTVEALTQNGAGRPLRQAMRQTIKKLHELRGDLDLTPEQKRDVAMILKEHSSEIIRCIEDIYEAHKALRQAVTASNGSESAIRRAAAQLGRAIGEGSVLRAKVRREVRAVMTAEQRRKCDAVADEIEKIWEEAIAGLAGK